MVLAAPLTPKIPTQLVGVCTGCWHFSRSQVTLAYSQAKDPLSEQLLPPFLLPLEGFPSLKDLSLPCLGFQALDHKVRTLTGDLSLREDSIAKLQKEKRALEELHQVGTTHFSPWRSRQSSETGDPGSNPSFATLWPVLLTQIQIGFYIVSSLFLLL